MEAQPPPVPPARRALDSTQFGHPPLTGGYVDRDAVTRMSDAALDAAWAEPSTRLLRVRAGEMPLSEFDERGAALDLIRVDGGRSQQHLYLGRVGGAAVFAIEDPGDSREREPLPDPDAGWQSPLACGALLPPAEAELMATALALIAWHDSAPYSDRTGSPTRPAGGGWTRLDEHGVEHFPRTDPVVIVLVEDGDRLLLGSNALWETGRFSLLAGFVEAGESAEQAVEREIWEESGLRVSGIRYVASQPWPFPRSFMLGFRARPAAGVDPEAVAPDITELSELRWFTREELRDPPPGIILPRPMSIARWLIDLWVQEPAHG